MDAVADITAVCLLIRKLAPEKIVVSPVHVGAGKVRCAHGVLPVPAPATAYILRDVPIYGGRIQGEPLHADGRGFAEALCGRVRRYAGYARAARGLWHGQEGF